MLSQRWLWDIIMCFLLLFLNNNATEEEFQLIIAMNRDESFARPTKPASIWQNDPTCVSGLDMEHEKEGGTWLAASSNGKIGALLNVHGILDPTKKGRGFLVKDFVKDTIDYNVSTYTDKIIQNSSDFNGFHLLLLERKEGILDALHFCSKEDAVPRKISDGCHVITNSSISKPWLKKKYGQKKFEDLMTKSCKTVDKDTILKGIWEILDDKENHLPDPNLESLCKITGANPGVLCSICVTKSLNHYGTRTQTVILVKQNGLCEYIEKTMCEPLKTNWHDNEWQTNQYMFQISN